MKGDENMRKFAICHYSNLMVDSIGVALTSEQTFLVTPEFEEHKAFKLGLELGMIELIEVTDWVQIKGAVGVTDEIIEEIKALLEVPEIEDEPEPVPDAEIDDSIEESQDAEITEVVEEAVVEAESEAVEHVEEPSLAFTEDAQSWQAAVALVKEETDVEKLTFALRNDERKSVKRACVARLKELREEKE